MKMSKMLLLLPVVALLLNGCSKVSNLFTSSSTRAPAAGVGESNSKSSKSYSKNEQGFWSRLFSSSAKSSADVITPTPTPSPAKK